MALSNKEKEVILEVYDTIKDTLNTLSDCNDLWLSDVRELETRFWQMYNQFEFIKKEIEKRNTKNG